MSDRRPSGSCREVIKSKLGWGKALVSKLRPDEIRLVLDMIDKHDEAERRIEYQASCYSTVS